MSEEIELLKKKIGANLEFFLQIIDIDKVIFEVKSQAIFIKYLEVLNVESTSEFKFRYLLNKIIYDKNEFRMFTHILLHTGHDVPAYMLIPEIIDWIDLSRFNLIDHNYEFHKEISKPKDSHSNSYRMIRPKSPKDSKRGICFLVNNYFTDGTHKEMIRFRNIFHQMKFEVFMKKNLTSNELLKELLIISKNDKLSDHTAFVFMSISHGNQNAEIYGFDGKPLKINKLLELFNDDNCPNLKNYPRMFFFNCCRGYDVNRGETKSLALPDPNATRQVPTKIVDFAICYSTLDGYAAKVDWNEGTKFGKALADSFVEKALRKDLNAIITWANQKVKEDSNQPFDWVQGLTRQVFFEVE